MGRALLRSEPSADNGNVPPRAQRWAAQRANVGTPGHGGEILAARGCPGGSERSVEPVGGHTGALELWAVLSVTYWPPLMPRLIVGLVSQLLQEHDQVVAGELPLEGCGHLLVATLEGGEALLCLNEVGKVVGS